MTSEEEPPKEEEEEEDLYGLSGYVQDDVLSELAEPAEPPAAVEAAAGEAGTSSAAVAVNEAEEREELRLSIVHLMGELIESRDVSRLQALKKFLRAQLAETRALKAQAQVPRGVPLPQDSVAHGVPHGMPYPLP